MPDDTAYFIVTSHPTYGPVLECFKKCNILTESELIEAITEGLNRNKEYWNDSARKTGSTAMRESYTECSRKMIEYLSLLEQGLDMYIDSLD